MEGGWCRAMTRTRLLAAPEPARSQAATWPIHGCCEPQAQTLVPALHLPLQQVPQLATVVPGTLQAVAHLAPLNPGLQLPTQVVALRHAVQPDGQPRQLAAVLVLWQYWPMVQAGAQTSVLQPGRPVRPALHAVHVLALVQVALQ